jgi:hypothetical protein
MTREERLATNEARFREMNEAAQPRRQEGDGAPTPGDRFICECADRGCTRWLELTPEEYAEVRAHPRRFIVTPTHEIPDVESVVDRHANYFVVEKPEEVAHIVDPGHP